MKTRSTLTLSLLSILALSACLQDEAAPPARTTRVEPGTTTRALGSLRFGNTAALDSGGENTRTETTLCDFAKDAGSVAILEFVSERQIIENNNCEGPYSRTYFVYQMRTVGVAAGQALPSEFEMVVLPAWIPGPRFLPQPGELWLTTARQSRGEWFLSTYSPISVDSTGDITAMAGGEYPLAEGFPADFEGLASALSPLITNLETSCPAQAMYRDSEATWDFIHFSQTYCHPDDPSDDLEPGMDDVDPHANEGNNVTSP